MSIRSPGPCSARAMRAVAAVLMLAFLCAQWALAAHTIKHAFAEPGEQHHCQLCIKADHAPAITIHVATPPVAVSTADALPHLELSAHFSSPRSPFLARGPPAPIV